MFKSILQACLMMHTCLMASVVNAYAVEMEDPFRPPEYKPVKPAKAHVVKKHGWHVNEILFSSERRVAIVNNIAVGIGDHVNNARVVDIKPAHVVLKYKDRIIKTRLKTTPVKRKANK